MSKLKILEGILGGLEQTRNKMYDRASQVPSAKDYLNRRGAQAAVLQTAKEKPIGSKERQLWLAQARTTRQDKNVAAKQGNISPQTSRNLIK